MECDLKEFIENLPDKKIQFVIKVQEFETKTVLTIARAMYKVQIVIMDEPTSALDSQTKKLLDKFFENFKNLTLIFITHEISLFEKI